MPTLLVEQYQYGDSGVLLNGPATLPFADVHSVTGLDSGSFRDSESPREGTHGSYVEALYQAARVVTIEGTLYADPNNMEAFLDSLKASFAPTTVDLPLYFKVDGATEPDRLVYGKSLGISYSKENLRRHGSANYQIQIKCGDPRIYSQTLTQASTSWGGGTTTLTLAGNRPSPGTLTITGPVTNPTITHTQSGAQFLFSAYTVASGQNLVINLLNRTVLQAGANKRNMMSLAGNWPEFVAGANTFTRGGSGSGSLTVAGRSAWW